MMYPLHEALQTLLSRYLQALGNHWPMLLAAAASGAALAAVATRTGIYRRESVVRRSGNIYDFFVALAVAGALYSAYRQAWMGDDAYISFRYAQNLAGGQGLVFNPGEKVEGYTNFLWTVLMATVIKVGLPAPEVSAILCVFCMVAALALTALAAAKTELSAGRKPLLPLAVIALAWSGIFPSYGTSGMETMLGAALVVGALAVGTHGDSPRHAFASGLLSIAATLNHPDHAIFYVCMGAAWLAVEMRGHGLKIGGPVCRWLLLWRDATTRARLAAYSIPFIVLFIPYFVWRYHYYGYFHPNTYYAKAAYLPYYSQGVIFFAQFLLQQGYWLLLPLLLLAATVPGKSREQQFLRVFAVGSGTIFGLYVLRVGGDFMYGRFFISLMPVLLLQLEAGLREFLATHENLRAMLARPALAAAAAIPLALGITPAPMAQPREVLLNITDEGSHYRITQFHPLQVDNRLFTRGQLLARIFNDWAPKPRWLFGSAGIVGFLSGLPASDTFGLVDKTIAHRKLDSKKRGRPGHEREADPGFLRRGGIKLSTIPTTLYGPRLEPLTRLNIEGQTFWIVRYEREMMKKLRAEPGMKIEFLDFETYLDNYIAKLPSVDRKEVERDMKFFNLYYFSVNEDPARKVPLDDFLRRAMQ